MRILIAVGFVGLLTTGYDGAAQNRNPARGEQTREVVRTLETSGRCPGRPGAIYSSPRESRIAIRSKGSDLATLTLPPRVLVGVCYDTKGPNGELIGNVTIRVAADDVSGALSHDQLLMQAPLVATIDGARIAADALIPGVL